MEYDIPEDITTIKYVWRKSHWYGDGCDSHMPKRCSHTSSEVNNELYIIGGGYLTELSSDVFVHHNDVWCINPVKGCMKKVDYTGDVFTGRRGHSAVVYDDCIYIFGGISSTSLDGDGDITLSNQLYVYNVRDNTMKEITGSYGELWPSARRGHISVVYNDCMYMFGGHCESLQDATYIFTYNFKLHVWKKYQTNGTVPVNLALSVSCIIKDTIYAVGGMSSSDHAHMHSLHNASPLLLIRSLNLISMEWREHSHSLLAAYNNHSTTPCSTFPDNRYCSSGCCIFNNTHLVIFGGTIHSINNTAYTYFNDILLISLDTSSTSLLSPSSSNLRRALPAAPSHYTGSSKNPMVPSARNGMTLSLVGSSSSSSLVLVGGGVFGNEYYNDVWVLDFLLTPRINATKSKLSQCSSHDSCSSICIDRSILSYYSTLLSNPNDNFADLSVVLIDDCTATDNNISDTSSSNGSMCNIATVEPSAVVIKCHRVVLSSRSTYFNRMLDGKFMEASAIDGCHNGAMVKLNQIKPHSFLLLRRYLYSAALPTLLDFPEVRHIYDCIDCANMLDCVELKLQCEECLMKKLKLDCIYHDKEAITPIDTLLETLVACEYYSCYGVINSILQYLYLRNILYEQVIVDEEDLATVIDVVDCSSELKDKLKAVLSKPILHTTHNAFYATV